MKAKNFQGVKKFTDIPNVGKRMTEDFLSMGIKTPQGLKGKSAFALYKKICKQTGVRHDPCVLDTYMAVIDFVNGAPAKPWWFYTAERKITHPNL